MFSPHYVSSQCDLRQHQAATQVIGKVAYKITRHNRCLSFNFVDDTTFNLEKDPSTRLVHFRGIKQPSEKHMTRFDAFKEQWNNDVLCGTLYATDSNEEFRCVENLQSLYWTGLIIQISPPCIDIVFAKACKDELTSLFQTKGLSLVVQNLRT